MVRTEPAPNTNESGNAVPGSKMERVPDGRFGAHYQMLRIKKR
ncbi:MAG: hypothetical protein ABFD10_07765 [Prolixibacteraceae bacterium]